MENKRIISDPTPENSPEVLTYGKDDLEKVFEKNKKTDDRFREYVEYSLIPRSYDDMLGVSPAIRKHWGNIGPYIHSSGEELPNEDLFFFAKWGLLKIVYNVFMFIVMLVGFPIVAGYLTTGVLNFFHVQNQETINLSSGFASFIVFITSFIVLMFIDFEPPLKEYRDKGKIFNLEKKGKIPAIQWRKAMDVQFLDYDFMDSKYDSDSKELDGKEKNEALLGQSFGEFKKLVSKFFAEERLVFLEKIDSTELSEAYNDYMEMMIFVLSNKESLSDDMTKKYIKNLDARFDVFNRRALEAIEAMTIVKRTEAETQASGKRIIQDMLDEDASNAMPLDPELKL